MIPLSIKTPDQWETFTDQLKTVGLPYEDLSDKNHLLVGYYEGDELIGTGGIEIYGDFGLIRSVSITAANRGKNLGTQITHHLINEARKKELKGLYLLTETAKDFFLKIGFELISRDEVAKPVLASSEFSHVCPVTAACMYLNLK